MANAHNPEVAVDPPVAAYSTTVMALSDLHCDAANARTHSEKNLQAIQDSIKQFGQVEPLVVQRSTGKVIGGNGRLEAMRGMGWKEAQVSLVDLDDVKSTALGIALNRSAELGRWDSDTLQKLLDGLKEEFPIDQLGFDETELSRLLKDDLDLGIVPEDYTEGAGAGSGEQEHNESTQHVRQVQLFFDEATHAEFLDLCDRAKEQYQAENLTDTVLLVMRANAKANEAS